MFRALRADLDRLPARGIGKLWIALRTPGIYPLALYRFGHEAYTRWPRWAAAPAKVAYRIVSPIVSWASGIHLAPTASIGPGLYIGHWGGIRVAPTAKLGRGCSLSPQVVIGHGQLDGVAGAPELGDRVYVGTGAKIIGPIRIGSNVAVGANAVVFRDVPDDVTVGGVPARIISNTGSGPYLQVGQALAAHTPSGARERPLRNEISINDAKVLAGNFLDFAWADLTRPL